MSGQLLDNISTEDTARDLNYLRQLVGDRKLTYVGWSYGTMIGQVYANLFPARVRAMMLNAVVNPTAWVKSAEVRAAAAAGPADAVFAQFVALCQGAARLAARSPAIPRPWPAAWHTCSGGRTARRSRHRMHTRPACSATATCC